MSDPFRRVYLLLDHGKYNDALAILIDKESGRVKKPFTMDINHAWYTVGDIFYIEKKYIEAINAFKKAFRNWPGDTESLMAIANCYSEIGRPAISQRYLLKALRLNKKINKNKAQLRYNLGNALFDQKKYLDAIKEYKKVGKENKQLYALALKNIAKTLELIKSREGSVNPTARNTYTYTVKHS